VFGLAAATVGCGAGTRLPTSPPSPQLSPTPAPLTCGVERWPVKTLSDADALRVNFAPLSSSVAILSNLPEHCGGGPDNARAYAEELQVFEVVGRIIVARAEDDRDFHVAIADPIDPGATMVTEVADPGCSGATASPFAPHLQAARFSFDAFRAGRNLTSLSGELVRVRGVGFYDFNHGQTGRSRSCIELHPILAIERAPF